MFRRLFRIICIIAGCLAAVGALVCAAEVIDPVSAPAGGEEKLIPDREIKYKEELTPEWKTNWDLARSLYRGQKYAEALVQYELLFTQKENVDEARWEYVSILMFLERWKHAKAELEKLLAVEPASIRYRIAMARANIETGNVENGIALYSQLLEQPLALAEKMEVLEGLIRGYELSGNPAETMVLLEELIQLKPGDNNLQIRLAELALQLGKVARAEEICRGLEKSLPDDTVLLTLRALVEEGLDNQEGALRYWQRIVELEPEHGEANRHLYLYYYDKQEWEKSFLHLEPVIKITPNDVDLLLRAADLNLKLGRVDRALQYYEYGLAVSPFSQKIIEEKKRAQRMLAQDLLALVENEGGKKLWQDLDRLTHDSVGVYQEIANLLREKNQIDLLIEVLMLLNKKLPDDQQIYRELAFLLEEKGYVDELVVLEENRNAFIRNKAN